MLSFYLPLCIICTIRLLRQAKDESQYDDQPNQVLSYSGDELQLKSENSEESFHENGGVVPSHSCESNDDPKMHSKKKPYSLCRIIPLQSPPWKYAGIAIADVYANYSTILAFKYTTITSVSLFDALAIPSAMLMSRLFFGRQYTKVHLLAVAVCCIGISINVLQDYRENEHLKDSAGVGETAQEELLEEEYPYKLAGDALAITGGILFGISNTLAEIAVRDWGNQDEFISAMSFFATIITFLQTLLTERLEVQAFFRSDTSDSCSELGSLTLLAIFVIATIVNYLGIASFLGMSDAAFLNLSLLTGDAWAVAFSVFAEGIVPPPTFYVALVITVSGVFIYETAPSPVGEGAHKDRVNEENEIEMRSNNDTTAHVVI
jgi:solute carrier family 35 protein F1/2